MNRAWTSALALALAVSFTVPAWADDNDDGAWIVLGDGVAQIVPMALVQGQFGIPIGDGHLLSDGDVMERTGFRLRRARLGIGGMAYGVIEWDVSLDATEDGINLNDAWVAWRHFSVLQVKVGTMKAPFSLFATSGSGEQALADRPLATRAMAPFRQLGFLIEGDVGNGILHYGVGVFNAFERNTNFHEGFVENAGIKGNRKGTVATAARVSLEPLGSMSRGIPDLAQGPVLLKVGGSFYYSDDDTVTSLGFGGDLLFKAQGLHLAAEFLLRRSEPATKPTGTQTTSADIEQMSVVGEIGYVFLKNMLGLTVRCEWLDPNTDIKDNTDELIITSGLQYYWHKHHFKVALEYTHREELEGLSEDDDMVLTQLHFSL